MKSPWLSRFVPRPTAALRLFCFSYAGGGAAIFRPWALGMPADVEVAAVLLPGRENRLRERPLDSMAALLQALLPALVPEFDRPFAFFGHSMGALVAFEAARALQGRGEWAPERLLLSGRRAPHLPEPETPIHGLGDDDFVTEIDRRYRGIPPEVMQHRDLLELLLPALRADMTVIETHRHDGSTRFAGPITVYGGEADERAPRRQLQAWQQHTREPLRLRQYAGGHFYFNEPQGRERLLGGIAAELRSLGAGVVRAVRA
jgi:medium-chain acyl-[acyl-carrier-protein] hydrolase